MRILHRYLATQVLTTLVMTVLVFTLILLLDNMRREILALLVNHQATLGLVAQAILLLVPFVMVFALPMGMLTATLLVFGRFSADNELTAARASGLSLLSLISPVILLSIALSILCGIFNLEVAPRCRIAYKDLIYHLGLANPSALISENRFIEDFPGHVLFITKKSGTNIEDVIIYKLDQAGKVDERLRAQHGSFDIDQTNRQINVVLTSVQGYDFVHARPISFEELPISLDLRPPSERNAKPDLSDMTFAQLRTEIRTLEKLGIDPTPATVHLHRQMAFSFACFGFTLVGIPLGIRAHRRETTAGIAFALVLVAVYYSFIILGQALRTHPEWGPQLIVWFPNILFQATGMVLLWRANRGI